MCLKLFQFSKIGQKRMVLKHRQSKTIFITRPNDCRSINSKWLLHNKRFHWRLSATRMKERAFFKFFYFFFGEIEWAFAPFFTFSFHQMHHRPIVYIRCYSAASLSMPTKFSIFIYLYMVIIISYGHTFRIKMLTWHWTLVND